MIIFDKLPCHFIVATLCCLGSLRAEATLPAAVRHSLVSGASSVRDDRRAEEWQRREILNSNDHSRGNSIELNANPYLLIIVLPLIGFILLVALIRMNDF